MPNLLFVVHAPSENTQLLRDAVIGGVKHPDVHGVELHTLAPLDASVEHVLAADGIIVGTTENFGAMAGRIKDFFERIYHPCLDRKKGLPFCFYVRAGNDGSGTRTGIERIATGLRWHIVQEPLVLAGSFSREFPERCAILGQTMAAGLEAGVY